MNIYVSNLGFGLQDNDLKDLFTPFGEVTSAKIINDRETGRSKGFGFVEMSDNAASQKAIAELNEASIEGRSIKVAEARKKETSGSFSNGNNYNNSNSYNKNHY